MSERKNVKRNKTRVPAKDRALHQSIQHNYNQKPINKDQLKLI